MHLELDPALSGRLCKTYIVTSCNTALSAKLELKAINQTSQIPRIRDLVGREEGAGVEDRRLDSDHRFVSFTLDVSNPYNRWPSRLRGGQGRRSAVRL